MEFAHISSLQNPRIKHLVRLREGTHRRRQGKFLFEGARELERALQCNWPLETVYFCEELFIEDKQWQIVQQAEKLGIELVQLTEPAFSKCAYRQGPDGLLAVAIMQDRPLQELKLPECPLLLVVERVEKPGNIGALLRTADAVGVDATIFCDPVTDLYNPNAIRASQGAFFSCPVAVTDNTTARLWLDEMGIRAIATSPDATTCLWDCDLRGPTALVVGAEDSGLGPDWLNDDLIAVHLPMQGVTDSVNVSVAAAVALFEALRQRRPATHGTVR